MNQDLLPAVALSLFSVATARSLKEAVQLFMPMPIPQYLMVRKQA